MTNQKYVAEYCANTLRTAFPHLQPYVVPLSPPYLLLTPISHSAQVTSFITGLREQNNDPVRFKIGLRDFLIQLREFQGQENDVKELFADEKEAEMAERAERIAQVPGMAGKRSPV